MNLEAEEMQPALVGQVEPGVGRPVPERDDFLAGICVALQCVTASDDGVLWREIVQTAGVELLLRYATFVEPEEWELAGFKRYAHRELHRARPRKCVPPLKTPNAEAKCCAVLPPQVPNEHGHLLTTQALWGMYVEDHEPPNAEAQGPAPARTGDD